MGWSSFDAQQHTTGVEKFRQILGFSFSLIDSNDIARNWTPFFSLFTDIDLTDLFISSHK
jgi:hypothetical protein